MTVFASWKLEYGDTSYWFGADISPVKVLSWSQEADVFAVDDQRAPRQDGIWFGQDFIEPGEIVIEAKIDFTAAPYPLDECVERAMSVRAELGRVWRADALRNEAGALAELTLGGDAVVEGRPRRARFDDQFQNRGLIYVELPFVPARQEAFLTSNGAAPWKSVSVETTAPTPSGGWVFPLVFPLEGLSPNVRATWFDVGGNTPASCIAEITGPIQAGAELSVADGFTIVLNRRLAYDETARVDARPGRAIVTVNDQPVNWLAPSSSRISELSLPPGQHQVSLRGVSPEGTASARLLWRNTKAGI